MIWGLSLKVSRDPSFKVAITKMWNVQRSGRRRENGSILSGENGGDLLDASDEIIVTEQLVVSFLINERTKADKLLYNEGILQKKRYEFLRIDTETFSSPGYMEC